MQHGRVLADSVTASLREAIQNGYFEPGEKLDLDLIAQHFDVSRTPVREAVRRLEAEGFVDIRPHHGAFIATVSSDDIRESYEVRALLEPEVVRQVTPLLPVPVLDELDGLLKESRAQLDAGDMSRQGEIDFRFHTTVLDFGKNALLRDVLESISNRISVVRRFALSRPGAHLLQSNFEHQAILQALRERSAEEAAELMRQHLQKSALRVQELAQFSDALTTKRQ